ncbi:MAG: hypothetical protein J1F42_14445 [Lachnospiraceae bacterium]|nr:hypothetical protein [Lachnospiraceae bacterium]
MKRENRLMIAQVDLKTRRNCFIAILLSLAMMLCGCGDVRGITESGTLWGIDGEGTVWGRDSLPEVLKIDEMKEVYASGDEICILYAAQTDKILVLDQQGGQKGSIDFGDGIVENIVSGDYAIYRFREFGTRVGVCPLDIQTLKKGETLYPLAENTRGLLEKEGMMDPDRKRIIWWMPCSALSDFGTKNEDNGEEYAFVGYPNPDGTMRTILRGGLEFAIVSTAGNNEGAWMFMEDLLSSAPAEKNLQLNQLVSNRNNMQKFVDNFERTLAAGRKVSSKNMILGAIVLEEADDYFNGTKSAEEVVDIIQNKVKLYLAENQ